jgi:hypothetical protein
LQADARRLELRGKRVPCYTGFLLEEQAMVTTGWEEQAAMTGRLIEVTIGVVIFLCCIIWASQGKTLSEMAHHDDMH